MLTIRGSELLDATEHTPLLIGIMKHPLQLSTDAEYRLLREFKDDLDELKNKAVALQGDIDHLKNGMHITYVLVMYVLKIVVECRYNWYR